MFAFTPYDDSAKQRQREKDKDLMVANIISFDPSVCPQLLTYPVFRILNALAMP